MEKVLVRFFDINKCGYYSDPKKPPVFGSINTIFQDLRQWATKPGMAVVNTQTFEALIDEGENNVYFCDIAESIKKDSYVLVLWHEVKNHKGKIYGISPKSTTGSTNILETGFKEVGAVPGFPSYYWIIPGRNKFATIKFENSSPEKIGFENYINGFMRNKSKYVVRSPEGPVGWALDAKDFKPENKSNMPYFKSSASINKSVEDDIIANCDSITRLVRYESIDYKVPDTTGRIEKFFSNLLENTPPLKRSATTRVEVGFCPTEAQVREIIRRYNSPAPGMSATNFGFKIGHNWIMLNGISVSDNVELNVSMESEKMLSAKSVLDALTQKKDAILGII